VQHIHATVEVLHATVEVLHSTVEVLIEFCDGKNNGAFSSLEQEDYHERAAPTRHVVYLLLRMLLST
jgi:hypothetical protein